jgi:hypothetical protein
MKLSKDGVCYVVNNSGHGIIYFYFSCVRLMLLSASSFSEHPHTYILSVSYVGPHRHPNTLCKSL